jgi:hypothetical protein
VDQISIYLKREKEISAPDERGSERLRRKKELTPWARGFDGLPRNSV